MRGTDAAQQRDLLGLRTMLTSGMPSAVQIFCSMCPRFDAAAVCTSPVWPSIRMVSTMPSAVRGFTKHEAASIGAVPSGRTRQCGAAMQRYCAYMAPPRMPTTLPRRACRVRRPCRHHDATPIPSRNGQANATRRGLHRLWCERRPHRVRGHTRIADDRAHLHGRT